MLKPARFYLFGIALALGCLVAAELIWVPAPIRTSGGMQWIEMIDWLFNLVALVPLAWAVGALLGLFRDKLWRGVGILLQLLRIMIAGLGFAAAGYVFFAPKLLFLLLVLIGAAAPFVFADMLISEMRNRIKADGQAEGAKPAASMQTRRGRLIWLPKRSGIALVLTLLLLLALLCPTGYLVTYPGMTLNLNRYAHVEGGGRGGTINGVLVFDRPAVPADWLFAKLLPMYSFEKTPENEPPLTETYAQVVLMKTDANAAASAIAMKKTGFGSGITPEGVQIVAVIKDSPADQRLQAGDIIEQLNGQAVRSITELSAYMATEVKPGDKVTVTLKRKESEQVVDLVTEASADTPERPVFGISVETKWHYDIPKTIDYKRFMAHLGGPSHGAMLTLALIDQLTPGGITHGIKIAGTGTIEPDGSIGLIGGIKQKAYAISRTDADVFFVPAKLEEAARSGAPELNIVPVNTIDDVLAWLAQH
ncbi:PDZ domain-containing protein [Paenibacillus paridis]|uniref:PDZ domain-containing protein n=1 Tax=Paenibacillus paridis TaxID=2583376 RepID=UPI001120595C|nr:PDZ domain-containing protein [Paenibacillus paridis]